MTHRKAGICTIAALVALAAFLAGCANILVREESDVLRLRVEKLLNAKVARDWGTVYELLDPAFRQKVSKIAFLNRPRNIVFKGFKIKDLQLLPSGKEAKVNVIYTISMRGFVFKNAPEVQRWVQTEGNWYLKMIPHANPFKHKES
jgi:hypothetical protein